MATLITGIEGFLGKKLARVLHNNGFDVIGLDITQPKEVRPWPTLAGDVSNKSLIKKIFREHQIERIIHAGGISGPHVAASDPAKVFEINIQGTLNLFEAARLHKMAGRMVFISSSSVYGQAAERASIEHPVVERLPLLASESYGASKVACESMARAYVNQENLDIISLRVSIVYGPDRATYCGITEMLKAALSKEPLILRKGADTPLPWIHIDDVTSAITSALEVPKEQIKETEMLAYNVTGPGYPTFREIAEIIQELIPGTSIEERDESDPYAMNARKMSLSAIKRDLHWEPQISIKQGVASLYKALLDQLASK